MRIGMYILFFALGCFAAKYFDNNTHPPFGIA